MMYLYLGQNEHVDIILGMNKFLVEDQKSFRVPHFFSIEPTDPIFNMR